jgi:Metallo-peptidase family M12B Reprolysin-like
VSGLIDIQLQKMKSIFFAILTLTLLACEQRESSVNASMSDKVAREEARLPTITQPVKVGDKVKLQGCAFEKNQNTIEIVLNSPSTRVRNVVERIVSFTGLPQNFKIFEADIDNAVATNISNNRVVVYDADLLSSLESEKTKGYWSTVSIIAHEIGHHLAGHTLSIEGDPHSDELDADRFSGHVLAKLGASLEEAQVAMNSIGSEFDSNSHPNKIKRLNAIAEGWYSATNQRYSSAIPPAPESKGGDDIYAFPLLNVEIHWADSLGQISYIETCLTTYKVGQIVILEGDGEGDLFVEALSDFKENDIEKGKRFYLSVLLDPDSEKYAMTVMRDFRTDLCPGRVLNVKIYSCDGGQNECFEAIYLQCQN